MPIQSFYSFTCLIKLRPLIVSSFNHSSIDQLYIIVYIKVFILFDERISLKCISDLKIIMEIINGKSFLILDKILYDMPNNF